MNKVWQLKPADHQVIALLAKELKISGLTAQALFNRGIKSLAEAKVFLKPRLANLRDPLEIPDAEKAARRVMLAKDRKEPVLVYGDYDVDGVTGTVILVKVLRFLGLTVSYYIPDRYGEGYSLSIDAVTKIAASGVKLIVSVDCGIASVKEVEQAKALGVDVIVTDHHNLPEQLPAAFALVNPKRIERPDSTKDLAGAGVAFKFAWALLKIFNIKDSHFITSLLDLAALGTFADVVPLVSENRILAVTGLSLINKRSRPGIKALCEVASLYGTLSANNVYFALSPRINAAGRLEHASQAVELLLTDDDKKAEELATQLNLVNVRRQDIGSIIREEVFAKIDEKYITANKVVVLSGNDWHPGVIGIAASRVVDTYYRPTVLIGINEGVGRGSARSIEGINIYELLDSCRDLFLDFGGHAGAAGFAIAPEKIPELTERLKRIADEKINLEELKPRVSIDAEVLPQEITLGLIKELDILAPHGAGNPQPIFMTKNLNLYDCKTVGKTKRHLKAKFNDGNITLDTIGFGCGELAAKLSYNKKYDLAYRLESNEWNGFESAQLSLVDVRESKDE